MECDPAPQVSNSKPDSENLSNSDSEAPQASISKPDSENVINADSEAAKIKDTVNGSKSSSTSDSNKENVNSGDSSGSDSSEKMPKSREVTKPKSPFTTVAPRQKKALTPGSRGAMLLNLSRRASMETRDSEVARSPAPAASPITPSMTQSPLRPWVKYAPSPSHASPSAGILKRSADDLDSSIEVRFNCNILIVSK